MTEYPTDREHLALWLNQHDLVGTMAEIGCAFGGYAETVLSEWRGREYLMIDPWIAQDASVYRERQEPPEHYVLWYQQCLGLAERDKRVNVIRKYSHDAAPEIPDGSLDCCYIDGNHSLEAVSQDLMDWFPKVKSGGLFGGHDFYDATHSGHWCQVESAVKQWAETNNQRFVVAPCSSWWTIKR